MLKRSLFALLAVLCFAVPALATPKLTVKTLEQSKARIYGVTYQVLQIVSPTAAQARVNDRLLAVARKDIAEFAKQAIKDHQTDESRPYNLSVQVHKEYLTDRWLSLSTRGGLDLGGAHPGPLYASFLFDLQSGRELLLADLFKPGSGYLKVLSDKCRADLEQRHDEMLNDPEWLNKGSAPTKDNYKVFFLDGKNLLIVFPPYQVASYAAGPQTIKIPYADLAAIAKPDGPLTQR